MSSEQFKGLEGLSKRFKIFSLFMFVVDPRKKEEKVMTKTFLSDDKSSTEGKIFEGNVRLKSSSSGNSNSSGSSNSSNRSRCRRR